MHGYRDRYCTGLPVQYLVTLASGRKLDQARKISFSSDALLFPSVRRVQLDFDGLGIATEHERGTRRATSR